MYNSNYTKEMNSKEEIFQFEITVQEIRYNSFQTKTPLSVMTRYMSYIQHYSTSTALFMEN